MPVNYRKINNHSIDFKIVGTSFRPKEDIQTVYDQLKKDVSHNVKLYFETKNPYDKNAIKVFVNNTHIGYIPKELCQRLKKLLLTHKIVTRTSYVNCGCSKKKNDSYHIILGFKKR
jgi:HIRAN domain